MDYSQHIESRKSATKTHQTKPIPGKKMVANSAGGYSFEINEWAGLDRFLVLGSEGGSYYASESKLTVENAKSIEKLIAKDGLKVVQRVVEISDSGRAPKNDPALFVLAMASAADDADTRKAALAALPKVARIGTHLFHYAQFVSSMRGWGRSLRRAIAAWYDNKSVEDLQYQLLKYKARDGWSHRDLLRLSHPKTEDTSRNALYQWTVDKTKVSLGEFDALVRLQAAERLANETDVPTAVKLINEFNLPREAVNTKLLGASEIWEALLLKMPATAMMRNLGNMSKNGLLQPMSKASSHVIDTLTDAEVLRKARIHPLSVLVALNTYNSGHSVRGSGTWTPDQNIVDALDEAFYMAFDAIRPTGKRFLLGIDVSGSMCWSDIAGMAGITPNVAAAAMAMVTARTEKQKTIMGFANNFRDLGIGAKDRLDAVVKKTKGLSFGSTDCALPMTYAMKNKLEVDAFVVYTDSETYHGSIHPKQAIDQYRQKTGINAKLIVVGMVANRFTIADPSDAGMLDVVGFDTAVPNIMSEFVGGKI